MAAVAVEKRGLVPPLMESSITPGGRPGLLTIVHTNGA
jgi:hypothetical protein